MRIRYLITHGYGLGGTVRTVVNQANAMAAVGHDVELVSVVRRRTAPQISISESVRLVTLVDQREPLDDSDEPGQIVPSDEARYKTYTRRVEDAAVGYLRELDDGVLVTSRPALNILAARFCPPTLVRVGQEHMHLDHHKPGVRAAIRRYYGALDAIVTLTATDRSRYEAELGRSELTITSIPNAVHQIEQPTAPLDRPIVIAAGRLTRQKGFDLLIRAFSEVAVRHPHWQLRIYGSGPLQAQLRALVHKHHLYNHVYLMGGTTHLDAEFGKASVFVLSSRYEGLPMVLIEAMSHGLPVVSFDCPTGPGEVITGGVDGILAPPEDVSALAGGISELICDQERRRKFGSAARERAQDFSAESIMPRWEGLFAQLLDRKRDRARR